MISNNYKIDSILYEDTIKVICEKYNINLDEANELIKNLSFTEYYQLITEAVIPPSQQIPGAPQVNKSNQPISPTGSVGPQPGNQPIGNLQGSAMQPGQTVGIKNDQGQIVPHQISNVDNSGNATVIDPKTGEQTTHDMTELHSILGQAGNENDGTDQSYNSNSSPDLSHPMPRTAGALNSLMQSVDYGDKELQRLRELAGINEDASGGGCSAGGMSSGSNGATVAGNIASVAKPLGQIRKRNQSQTEEIKTTSDKHNVSIHGKIDPRGASGELSRRLADANMKTATRKNNGKKIT